MALLVALSVVFCLLTLYFAGRTIRCTRRGRLLRAGGSGIGGACSAALATAGLVLVVSYASYSRLTAERPVSRIEFTRTAPLEYRARLMIDGERDRFFLLSGDEWQMDVRIVTWKPPATVLGLDPIYRLERLSGRYSDVDREQREPRSVHALSPRPALDVWSVARRFPLLLPGVDAYYGTATYVPMADGARYEVSLSRDALIARPANDAARAAVSDWN
jgi:hypothetical protein